MSEPVEGAKAPAFTLRDGEGNRHSLRDYAGLWVVLYFYPRDNTPGCTREACDFRDAGPRLARLKVAVLGVSTDSAASHQKFSARHGLNFPLLVDEDGKVSRAYGVWQEKNLYGRKTFGIVRSTFLIDPEGKLRKIYRKVRVQGHIKEVMEFLKTQR